MAQRCVRCGYHREYGHRDPTNQGWWYCEDCWMASTGRQRCCNRCRRWNESGSVCRADSYWYCNACWDPRPPAHHSAPPLAPPPGYGGPPSTWPPSHARGPAAPAPAPAPPFPQPLPAPVSYQRLPPAPPAAGGARRQQQAQPQQKQKGKRPLEQTPEKPVDPTTLMLRNLPPELTRDGLHAVLDAEGIVEKIDFIYVPTNFAEKVNFGYAFINVARFSDVSEVRSVFSGFDRWPSGHNVPCEVNQGDSCQGLKAHIDRYRNSPVMHQSIEDEYRPGLYANGVRQRFPSPTRPIKPPRRKRRKNTDGQAAAGGGPEAGGDDDSEDAD